MAAFAGEVIDGVIATVNRKPLLQSDWDDAVRFEAFMQQKPLASVTEADRASALQRLIDRRVLEIQMTDANYLAPSREEIRADIAKLRAQIPAASDEQGWQKLIAAYGFSQRDIEANVRREMQMMNFIEVRLRPNVHVQPEEVEAYYRTQVLPDMEKAGVKVVTLQEVKSEDPRTAGAAAHGRTAGRVAAQPAPADADSKFDAVASTGFVLACRGGWRKVA